METAGLPQIKKELTQLTQPELIALCLKLSKFKKENKELMSYLLFEAEDEPSYIAGVKKEIDDLMDEVNKWSAYQAKKTIRKALRLANRYIKYSNAPGTDIEIVMHYCLRLKKLPLIVRNSQVIINIFDRQIERINKAISKLHEDLQFDYQNELEESGLVD